MTTIDVDVDAIRDALNFIPARDRDLWVRIGMAVKSELGDDGFDLWSEWSQSDDSYEPRAAKSVWKSINANGRVTIRTLFHEAQRYGWRGRAVSETRLLTHPSQSMPAVRPPGSGADDDHAPRERAETAGKARALLEIAVPARSDHPYLQRKMIHAIDALREIDVKAARTILGYSPQSGGMELLGRLLVAPVMQGSKVSTVELIDEAGRKSALAGRGTKSAGYWPAQSMPDGDGNGITILIGEGIATVLTAKQATGHLAVASLSSGNLRPVAGVIRARYPIARIIVIADLVKSTGMPEEHARNAAAATSGLLAVPSFPEGRQADQKDMNDLAAISGLHAVAEAIVRAMPVPDETDATPPSLPEGWVPPQPLTVRVAAEPYPVDALPPLIGAAVEEVHGFVKAPVVLVASSAIAALSVAAQAHVNVARAEQLQGPVGVYVLTIADSGERKTTCDGFFTAAIREYQGEQLALLQADVDRFKAEHAAWNASREGLLAAIRESSKSGKPTAELRGRLEELQAEEPKPPRVPKILLADETPESLAWTLANGWPAAGILSSEAGVVFGAHGMGRDSAMRNMSFLNILWDGGTHSVGRRTSESFIVRGARLTVALQVQEPTLREFFAKSGVLARGSGFLARFLVAWPESTQGQRMFEEAPPTWPHLSAFNRRIAELLNRPVPISEDGSLQPDMLKFSPDAKAAWIEYHDEIEQMLGSGGELFDVRDVASKAADNAARLAALFHMFAHGPFGAIDHDTFKSASIIAAWHLNEARRFFGELALPPELSDAARLDSWVIEHCQREKVESVPKNHVRQHGPLRDGARLDAAIRELANLDRLRLTTGSKPLMIYLNPELLG